MIYYGTEKKDNGIYLIQDHYDSRFNLKTESVFSQSNGYFGIRAANGLPTLEGKRGMFVAGVYNSAYEDEVTELVNCPDITAFRLILNGESVSPDSTEMRSYERRFHIHTGELRIRAVFVLETGEEVVVTERRFASMDNPHLFAHKVTIAVQTGGTVHGKLVTAIDAQQTNSGVSHFEKVDCRVYDRKMMHIQGYVEENTLSVLAACSDKGRENCLTKEEKSPVFTLKRRAIECSYEIEAATDKEWEFQKYVYVHKQEDKTSLEGQKALLGQCIEEGYETVFQAHKTKMKPLWQQAGIHIEGASVEEEASIAFAQYHLMGMMPWGSSQSSIAAKGLTGEGYKGHVFWDTEIFMLPFFLFNFPEAARHLLEFRYNGLDGARGKAVAYGYEGAMYPWEAAVSGREETPLYAALNIYTGKANKVWSGIKEHHVTADIAYAVWQYYSMTKDESFMECCGYEIIFEVASFWVSRAVWDEHKNAYVINDIIGPDEYTEHIDNNTYTNYMAQYSVSLAVKLAEKLADTSWQLYRKLGVGNKKEEWNRFAEKIFLQVPNDEQIIPQDDTFLSKQCMTDIEKYKKSDIKQAVLQDYSRDEIVDMQVLKQADTVMLLNLFPRLFAADIVKKNVLYYEARTIHDSSLSYCAHAQASAAIGEINHAWKFFEKCMVIDLDGNPNDTTDGVHAASLGGIWTCTVFGFAGVNFEDDILHISPRLPEHWKRMDFNMKIKGKNIRLSVSNEEICLQRESSVNSVEGSQIEKETVKVEIAGQTYLLQDLLQIRIQQRKEDKSA